MFQRLTTTARTREEEREAYSSPAISDAHKIRLYSPREAKALSTAHQRPTGEEEEEESLSTIRETLSLEAAAPKKSSARPPSPSPWKANLAGLPRLSNTTNEKKRKQAVEAPSSSSRAKRGTSSSSSSSSSPRVVANTKPSSDDASVPTLSFVQTEYICTTYIYFVQDYFLNKLFCFFCLVFFSLFSVQKKQQKKLIFFSLSFQKPQNFARCLVFSTCGRRRVPSKSRRRAISRLRALFFLFSLFDLFEGRKKETDRSLWRRIVFLQVHTVESNPIGII